MTTPIIHTAITSHAAEVVSSAPDWPTDGNGEKVSVLPVYTTEGAACADVRAIDKVTINPGCKVLVGTGLRVAIPEGWEIVIRPRSGLSVSFAGDLRVHEGTIDSDYRDEVMVVLFNRGDSTIKIPRGTRIAQFKVQKAVQGHFKVDANLGETERLGGFGSTGEV